MDPYTRHPGYTQLWINGKYADGDEYQIGPADKFFHTTIFLNKTNRNTIPHEVGGHYGYNSIEFVKYLLGLAEGKILLNYEQDNKILKGGQNAEIYELLKTLNINIDPSIIQNEANVF